MQTSACKRLGTELCASRAGAPIASRLPNYILTVVSAYSGIASSTRCPFSKDERSEDCRRRRLWYGRAGDSIPFAQRPFAEISCDSTRESAWPLTVSKRITVDEQEQKADISLNSESISTVMESDPKRIVWADVPMRALAGGFYANLMSMYDYLDVRYRPQPFLFSFANTRSVVTGESGAHKELRSYMVHSSNFHQVPPRPLGVSVVRWLFEASYVVLCYVWFTICVYLVAPRDASPSSECESIRDYLRRIALPEYYAKHYLLPLMSSVCTCSHEQMLDFPASDLLEYKRRTHRQEHYVVDSGVQEVQEKLAKGLDIRLNVCLTKIARLSSRAGVEVTWIETDGNEGKEVFDLVVLAVSPDITALLFEPLACSLAELPTTTVGTVAHTDRSSVAIHDLNGSAMKQRSIAGRKRQQVAQHIYLCSDERSTESIHEQTDSLIVTTNPISPINHAKIIRTSTFTRVLRSPKSRRVVNDIFKIGRSESTDRSVGEKQPLRRSWRNGDDGVFLAGGWCWDGMVLLEGCIVSAMRIASSLNVAVPWQLGSIDSNLRNS